MNKLSEARLLESHSQGVPSGGVVPMQKVTASEYKKVVRLYTQLEELLAKRATQATSSGVKQLKMLLHELRETECMVARHISGLESRLRKDKR